jgi:hypothetical protein
MRTDASSREVVAQASAAAAERDGGAGVIEVDGVACFVEP